MSFIRFLGIIIQKNLLIDRCYYEIIQNMNEMQAENSLRLTYDCKVRKKISIPNCAD